MFIFFISLFKGIHLYNLRINNIEIKHLFLKIHNKIILKANYIKIIPQQEVSKDVFTIHKKLLLFSKIAQEFEKLTLKNITYKNIKIPLIEYKNNTITINSNLISIKGNFKLEKTKSILKDIYIKYQDYKITNLNGYIKFSPQKIDFSSTFKLNNSNATLTLKIINNLINYHFSIQNFKHTINSYFVKVSNFNSKGTYNLTTNYYKIFATAKKAYTKVNNLNIYLKEATIYKLTPKSIKFSFLSLYIPSITKEIKKLYLKNPKGTLFFNPFMLIVSKNDFASLKYENYTIKAYKNSLIYENQNNFNFTSSKIIILQNDLKITSNKVYIFKFKDYFNIQTKNNILKKTLLKIYAKIFYLYNHYIEIPKLNGNYKKIPFKAYNFVLNLNTKQGIITKAYIKRFKFSPIYFNLKNHFSIQTKSNNIKIDSSFKKILSKFGYQLGDIYQLKGKNYISLYYKDIPYWELNATSYNGEFLISDYHFFYRKLKANLKNFNLNSSIKSLYLPTETFKILANLKLKGNIKKSISIDAIIKNFNILKFFKMKNYKEKIALNLKNEEIILKNTKIALNLKTKMLIFKNLSKIIQFTPISSLIKGGEVFVNFNIPMIINGIIYLTKPLILNHKNPFKIPISIEYIPKQLISIKNDFSNTLITNNSIKTTLNNLDINASALIYIYNTINNLIPKSNSSSNTAVFITAHNTNFIYQNHKFLSTYAKISYTNKLKIYSKHNNAILKGETLKDGTLILKGYNYTKKELTPLLDFFNKFKKIEINFNIAKYKDTISGDVTIKKGIVKELKLLNNIIAFINTIPSLLSLQAPGFSAKGYKIKKGYISYVFSSNILRILTLNIEGNNLGFIGKGAINFNTKKMNLDIVAIMKIKLKKIPILGKGLSYILFGKDGNLYVGIKVTGSLDNPKIKQKLPAITPSNIIKRIITLPFNIL